VELSGGTCGSSHCPAGLRIGVARVSWAFLSWSAPSEQLGSPYVTGSASGAFGWACIIRGSKYWSLGGHACHFDPEVVPHAQSLWLLTLFGRCPQGRRNTTGGEAVVVNEVLPDGYGVATPPESLSRDGRQMQSRCPRVLRLGLSQADRRDTVLYE